MNVYSLFPHFFFLPETATPDMLTAKQVCSDLWRHLMAYNELSPSLHHFEKKKVIQIQYSLFLKPYY